MLDSLSLPSHPPGVVGECRGNLFAMEPESESPNAPNRLLTWGTLGRAAYLCFSNPADLQNANVRALLGPRARESRST